MLNIKIINILEKLIFQRLWKLVTYFIHLIVPKAEPFYIDVITRQSFDLVSFCFI